MALAGAALLALACGGRGGLREALGPERGGFGDAPLDGGAGLDGGGRPSGGPGAPFGERLDGGIDDSRLPDGAPGPVFLRADGGLCAPVAVTLDSEAVSSTEMPNVYLLVDASTSMRNPVGGSGFEPEPLTRWQSLRRAVTRIQRYFGGRVRFGLVTFAALGPNRCPIVDVIFPADHDDTAIEDAMQELVDGAIRERLSVIPEGTTPTGETFQHLLRDPPWVGPPRDGGVGRSLPVAADALVLVTDGEPTGCRDIVSRPRDLALAVEQVREAHRSGLPTAIVSVGIGLSRGHLQDLANAGAGVAPGEPDAPWAEGAQPAVLESILIDSVDRFRTCRAALPYPLSDAPRACDLEVRVDGERLRCNVDFRLAEGRAVLSGAPCDAVMEGALLEVSACLAP
jgi:hypothetical protein